MRPDGATETAQAEELVFTSLAQPISSAPSCEVLVPWDIVPGQSSVRYVAAALDSQAQAWATLSDLGAYICQG